MPACVHERFYSYTRSRVFLLVSVCTICRCQRLQRKSESGFGKTDGIYISAGAIITVVGGVVVIVYGGTIVASIGACWTAVVTALGKTPIAITIGKCG